MQFVEVTGAVPAGHANPDGRPVIQGLELVHVRTALPEAGTFQCSSDLYNRTHQLIDWAMRLADPGRLRWDRSRQGEKKPKKERPKANELMSSATTEARANAVTGTGG